MPKPKTFDVHCMCGQVILPADHMRDLSDWMTGRNADKLVAPDIGPALILNCDLLCKNCGRMVYFRLNEQRLIILLDQVSTEVT